MKMIKIINWFCVLIDNKILADIEYITCVEKTRILHI